MKRFDFEPPKKEPTPKTATANPKYPGVQREHIFMIAHIWNYWLPIVDPDITPEIAAHVWAHFVSSPPCQSHDVIALRILSDRVWSRWVQLN